MNTVHFVPNVNLKESSSKKIFIAIIAFIILLLSMRDIGGIGVNKYLFLIITAVAAFALPIDRVMYFIAFVMPLYVGLPGNYMTLIFLARFLFDCQKLHIKTSTFIFCVLAGSYALIQAFITNHTAIPELMFFPGMILIMFMFSIDVKISKKNLILSYATGVAALGLIMLIHTLQIYEFNDLLNSATRLGAIIIDYNKTDEMLINVDPNFYGFFSIAAISLGVESIDYRKKEKLSRHDMFEIVVIISCIMVGLIGLSRAFLLVLIAWLLLYLLSVKNIKAFFIAICVFLLVTILVVGFIPGVWETFEVRFHDSSMATANGRSDIIIRFTELWSEKITSILFGVGIFDCNVHCMPLQVLFGGGVVFCILFIAYMMSFLSNSLYAEKNGKIYRYLPLFVTLLMSFTVPALALVNTMFPIALVGICMCQGE